MTDSYRPGPGTLTLGGTEFNMQLSNCRIDPTETVDSGDDLNLLDGTTLEGVDDATYSFTLAGTAVQDLNDDGITAYTWENMGEEVAFVFTPNTARVASVAGTCRIVPISLGGAVKVRNTADFAWAIIGTPEFTPQVTP